MRQHISLVTLSLLLATDAYAQIAVVERNVNLRVDPSTNEEPVRKLEPPEKVTLLSPTKVSNYYHVVTEQSESGYVWAANVEVEAGTTTPALESAVEVFHGCPPEGIAATEARRALNKLKNRNTAPAAADFQPTTTLDALLEAGDDTARWDGARAAEIVGFINEVKPGGIETCNCRESEAQLKDTHIEVVVGPTDSGKTRRVVVEITPKWRELKALQGIDWTTAALRTRFKHKTVRVRGWMFFDGEHDDESENTAPGREGNWRATAWELHPVTSIELAQP